MSNNPQDLIRAHFSVYEKKSDHHFRTEIPNIIFDMDLDLYEFKLYVCIKKIAGDDGGVWQSKSNLAKNCEISKRKMDDALKILSQNFEILGNQPLIFIKERKKDDGSDDTPLILINDIWRINGDYNRKKFQKEDLKKSLGGCTPCRGGVHAVQGEGAPGAPKEDPSYQDPNKKDDCIEPSAEIIIFDCHKNKTVITKDNLYFICSKNRFNWTVEEIEYLYLRLAKHKGVVSELTKFCSAIIDKKRSIEKIEKSKDKKEKSNQSSGPPLCTEPAGKSPFVGEWWKK